MAITDKVANRLGCIFLVAEGTYREKDRQDFTLRAVIDRVKEGIY